jgi:hypothetical protein
MNLQDFVFGLLVGVLLVWFFKALLHKFKKPKGSCFACVSLSSPSILSFLFAALPRLTDAQALDFLLMVGKLKRTLRTGVCVVFLLLPLVFLSSLSCCDSLLFLSSVGFVLQAGLI